MLKKALELPNYNASRLFYIGSHSCFRGFSSSTSTNIWIPQERNRAAGRLPHICVVGTGPSGTYSAKYLLKHFNHQIQIDFFDQHFSPYGLLRYGVSPDHPEIRRAAYEFDKLCPFDGNGSSLPCRFFGFHKVVGRAPGETYTNHKDVRPILVSLASLRQYYDAVLLAIGAEVPSRLAIPGCELQGIIAAGDLIKWLNGYAASWAPVYAAACEDHLQYWGMAHPAVVPNVDTVEASALVKRLHFLDSQTQTVRPELSPSPRVVIIGNGNVALDVARLLLKKALLKGTSIDPVALEAIVALNVQHITVIGRRSLTDASFSPAELREVLRIPGVTAMRSDLGAMSSRNEKLAPFANAENDHTVKEVSSYQLNLWFQSRLKTRLRQVLEAIPTISSGLPIVQHKSSPTLYFLNSLTPVRYIPHNETSNANETDGKTCLVGGIECITTTTAPLEYAPRTVISADLVIESVGFEQPEGDGFALSENRKFLQNDDGLLTPRNPEARLCPVYAAGWCRAGPKGAISVSISEALVGFAVNLRDNWP